MLCLFLLFGKLKALLLGTYPSLRRLAKAPPCQVLVRLLCGFCQIAAIVLCILLKFRFLDIIHVAYVVFGVAIVGALVYQNSLKYRCITNLMTMLFLGRSGKALLITLLLTMVVSGVVHNLWTNSVEMVRVFVCTTMIHIRLTKMKFELLTTPFLDQFHTAVDSRKQLRDEVERMTAFIHPAIEAVENPDPGFTPDNSTITTEPKDPDKVTAMDYVEGYRGKLYSQCLYQIKETQRVCRQNYTHLYLKCVETVTLIQTYCDPFKVENYCSISKIVSGSTPESFCDTTNVIPGQMGDAYKKLMKNRNLIETARNAGNVSYNITSLPTLPGIEVIKLAAEDITAHIKRKKHFFHVVLSTLTIVDVFILLNLILKTLSYYRHYVMDIDFDNIYLTDELRQIDKDRAVSGRPSVLPLKHFERDFYVDPLRKQLRRREWFSISYSILLVVLIVLGVSGLFLIDWIYYTGLQVVRENALVNFTQSGSFNFTLTVNGSGLLARVIRNATMGLNATAFQSMNETNAECLPNPTLTHWHEYLEIYALALVIMYMNVNLMYSQRMMSVICGHSFKKKHGMRLKYLYNQMLIRRRVYFEESLLNLLAQGIDVRKHRMGGLRKGTGGTRERQRKKECWTTLVEWFGRKGKRVMQIFGGAAKEDVVHCSVCMEREDISVTGKFKSCGVAGCEFRYCSSCWQNLDHHCVAYYASKEGQLLLKNKKNDIKEQAALE